MFKFSHIILSKIYFGTNVWNLLILFCPFIYLYPGKISSRWICPAAWFGDSSKMSIDNVNRDVDPGTREIRGREGNIQTGTLSVNTSTFHTTYACFIDCIQTGPNTFVEGVPKFWRNFLRGVHTWKKWYLALQNLFWSLGCVKNAKKPKNMKNQVFEGFLAIAPKQ